MTWKIEDRGVFFVLINSAGNLARTSDGLKFHTTDRDLAAEATDYLNQPIEGVWRVGSHRVKSIFGKC